MDNQDEHFEALLNRLMAGNATESEQKELERLIAGDAQKRLLYRLCTEDIRQDRPAAEAAFERHWELIRERGYRSPKKTYAIRWWTVAAAAAVLVFVGWFAWDPTARNDTNEYTTENGQRRQVELPDGSTVWLNGGSKLVVDEGFNVENRQVSFRGEGYFDISDNAKLPFEIDAGEAKLRVLGTAFNVRAYEEEGKVEAALITGKLEVTSATSSAQRVLLTPGKKIAIYNSRNPVLPVDEPIIQLPLANDEVAVLSDVKIADGEVKANDVLWRENKLVFDGDPLELIVSKLEKWYGGHVMVSDSTLNDLKFSGIFENMELDAVLNALSRTGSIRYTLVGDTVMLRPGLSQDNK